MLLSLSPIRLNNLGFSLKNQLKFVGQLTSVIKTTVYL